MSDERFHVVFFVEKLKASNEEQRTLLQPSNADRTFFVIFGLSAEGKEVGEIYPDAVGVSAHSAEVKVVLFDTDA